MQLRRLRVKNIRSYESGQIDFGPGTTLVSGDVGAGKTSLLYAIEMALFGISEVDAAYLVRHGAGHAEVEVDFEGSGHRYRIGRRFRRVRRRGKETFEPEKIAFRIDGAETTYSATELRQRVIELLGFPDNPNPQAHSDLWRWAVYVPQERMRDILSARAQDRLETVRKALGVERYRTAAENAQELATDLRRTGRERLAEADRLRHFDVEHAEATADSDRLSLERRALDTRLAETEAGLERARTARGEAEATIRRGEADARELEGLEREHATDERFLGSAAEAQAARRAEAERLRSTATAAEPESSQLDAARATLAAMDRERAAALARLDALAGTLRALSEANAERTAGRTARASAEERRQRAEAEREARRLERDAAAREGPAHAPPSPTDRSVADIDRAIAAARTAEDESLAARTRSESALAELDELLTAGVCPRCHQSVRPEEFAAHRAETGAETERLRSALTEATRNRERLEQERRARERYDRAIERWNEVARRRELAEGALARSEASLAEATDELRAAEGTLSAAEARVASLGPAEAEEGRVRAAVSAGEEAYRRAAEAVERSAAAAERRRAALEAARSIDAVLERTDAEIARAEERVRARAPRREELRRASQGLSKARDELRRAESDQLAAERAVAVEKVAAARAETQLLEAARRLRAAEKGRVERANLLAEAKDLEAKAEWVAGPFRTALLAMEQKLLAHAVAAFERDFARYFASLIDDPALVAETDIGFTPAVSIDGEWTPAEALSGGERTSLALAFRLALAQVVRGLGNLQLETVLLDEPTDGFSPEQVVRMGELLDELALPQVVIVSHEGELAAIADRVVRVEKQDGRSRLVPASGAPSADAQEAPAPSPTRRSSPGRTARGGPGRAEGADRS